ncbi:hypothetical protein PT974_12203 [Cladobotryum mycophilum]|uniref:Chromo domain-containing protein n=1 Tax=Cladobotryum mycophilum TaxID=491253 RepID=A0ABR0S8C6_9HYPO
MKQRHEKNKKRGRLAQDHDKLVQKAINRGLTLDRSKISPHKVHRTLRPKSQKSYSYEMERWKAFLKEFPDSDPRDMQTLKQYAEYLGLSMTGKLDKNAQMPTTSSVRNKLRQFCNAWERDFRQSIPQEVRLSMSPYVEGELAKKIGLFTGKKSHKEKSFFTVESYGRMQIYHWAHDTYDYVHDGYRVDNTNLLNGHCFTSARLQEICQAKYQDLKLMLSWNEDRPEFRLSLTREICKGNDINQPEHTFAEWLTDSEGLPPPLFAQPILHWLANIISSGVSAELRTVDDALKMRPPAHSRFRVIEWQEEMKQTPVFPTWTRDGQEKASRNPTSWGSQASSWANRAGFPNGVPLHALRREALIKCNDHGYSLPQVLKFASQNNTNVLVNHYLGNISTIDGAANFLGMQHRTDLAEDFRSATMKWNPNLQSALSMMDLEKLEKNPDYQEVCRTIDELTRKIATTSSESIRTDLQTQRSVVYEERRAIQRKTLKQIQTSQPITYNTNGTLYERHQGGLSTPKKPGLDICASGSYYTSYKRSQCGLPSHVTASSGALPSFLMLSSNEKYTHHEWVASKDEWQAHCQAHINQRDVPWRCDPVTFRHATACAGYCPVCLGNAHFPAYKRLKQYPDRAVWKKHISHCISVYIHQLTKTSEYLHCPHWLCDFTSNSKDELWYHLGDIHSIPKAQKNLDIHESPSKPLDTQRSYVFHYKVTGHISDALSGYSAIQCDDKPTPISSYTCSLDGHNTECVEFSRDTQSNYDTSDTLASANEHDWPITLSPGRTGTVSIEQMDPMLFSTMEKVSVDTPMDKPLSEISEDVHPENTYEVQSLLAKWKNRRTELFLVKWREGGTSWQPKDDIMDDKLINDFKETYKGFKDGIEVIGTRKRRGKVEYHLRFQDYVGANKDSSWWVPEKSMHPDARKANKRLAKRKA